MKKNQYLTNEGLRQRFKSQFELVNHAIVVAQNMIKSGRGTRVKTECQNKAYQVLQEITEGKDYLEEIPQGRERHNSQHHNLHQGDAQVVKAMETAVHAGEK